ncbi:hypothetical protein [Flammeovirga sp. SubArs3]|uniref:hypothetical protein n=1 Tax=Flammeovirga sp. SubArs3 TaxID=2995316 RepID=UPI00248B4B02|nr:hypothetical protein [Flammeovirga sp. SubArs3]
MNTLQESVQKVQANILSYQQHIDDIKEVTDKKKTELKAEASLKINDTILQKEIEALESLNHIETTSKDIIDKVTNMNKALLDFSENTNDKILDSLKENAEEMISNSNLLKAEAKNEITEKTVDELVNLQDHLEELICKGRNLLDEMSDSSKLNVDKASQNLERVVSKTGDIVEDISNKLIY